MDLQLQATFKQVDENEFGLISARGKARLEVDVLLD